jgi:hypothetical protein
VINYEALIHDRKFFELDHIRDRQTRHNFTQAVKVEMFLWDLELYGQLQRHLGETVVLKGGAAAQLFFAAEKQRTSVDIDVIYLGDEESLPETLAAIHKNFGEDDLYFKFVRYEPENPKTQLPLITYFVPVPTVTGAQRPANIKIDFHLMDEFDLPTIELDQASAFVVPLAFKPRCLSPGALIGDKLLTLAQGSVGIPPEREDDIPKQLYDLDGLTTVVSDEEFEALQTAMEVLFDRELSVRPEKVPFERALEQMIVLLERYSGLDAHRSDLRARTAIQNFRGNYEPRPFKDLIIWGITSKRLGFLVKCISSRVNNPLSQLKNAKRIEKIVALEQVRFKEDRIRLQQELREEFFAVLKSQGRPETAKRLKNSRLERLFWEIVTPSNLEEIQKKVMAKTANIVPE